MKKTIVMFMILASVCFGSYEAPGEIEFYKIPTYTPLKIFFSYRPEKKLYSIKTISLSADMTRIEMEKFVSAIRKTLEWNEIAKKNKADVDKAAYVSPEDANGNVVMVVFTSDESGAKRFIGIRIGSKQHFSLGVNLIAQMDKAEEIIKSVGDLDAIERNAISQKKRADELFK